MAFRYNITTGGRSPPNCELWLGRHYGTILSVISRDRAPTFFGNLLWETEIIADKIGPQGVVYRRFW
jgi:hypothetical protein